MTKTEIFLVLDWDGRREVTIKLTLMPVVLIMSLAFDSVQHLVKVPEHHQFVTAL